MRCEDGGWKIEDGGGILASAASFKDQDPRLDEDFEAGCFAILCLLSSIFAFRFLIPLCAKSYFLNRSVTLFLAALISPFFKSFNALPANASAADWTI
jgi:hypothetical protein